MSFLFETRQLLKTLLADHIDLACTVKTDTRVLEDVQKELDTGELSVAVVGEIKRGKSTFLNALMGARVFPSRATICTACVTVLDNAPKSRIEIYYKTGKPHKFECPNQEPAAVLEESVTRKNKNVKDLSLVRIFYPNKFTGQGIVLVDTPGVNDTECWREEITYSFLASADAVIMLLDPMQPLSASEIEFLSSKILAQSIRSLLFIVNRIDEVNQEERASALNRIYKLLSAHVPNPAILAVASKPALEAKQTGNQNLLNTSGFPEFEERLLDFLAKGRGGLLMRTKIQKAQRHLAGMEEMTAKRLNALNEKRDRVVEDVASARDKLEEFASRRKQLEKDIQKEQAVIASGLSRNLEGKKEYFHSTLVPLIRGESDPDNLRRKVFAFQRDTIEYLNQATAREFNLLLNKFGVTSQQLSNDISDLFNHFSVSAESTTQLIQPERRPVEPRRPPSAEVVNAGKVIGGVVGATTGSAIASSLTLSTLGGIGLGILTGGLGLLIGAGAAWLLGSSSDEQTTHFVENEDMVDNSSTIKALESFLKGLQHSIDQISRIVVQNGILNVIGPLNEEMNRQRSLMHGFEEDLNRTEHDQKDVRNELNTYAEKIRQLKQKYDELLSRSTPS